MNSIIAKLAEAESCGKTAALCIVTGTQGSTPAKTGAKMIVYEDGSSEGTVGGGNLEKKVIEDAKDALASGKVGIHVHNLTRDHSMCCGGTVSVYIEPIARAKKLFIFGAGHIGKHLAGLAGQLGFDVTLIDERAEMFEGIETVDIAIVNMPHKNAFDKLTYDDSTYIFICTHLHEYDREILARCIRIPHKYLGMIGSRRKVEVTKKIFIRDSVATEEELSQIDMPAGIDIGASTPAEIALSIIAKMISVGSNQNSRTNSAGHDLELVQCIGKA